MQFRKIWLHYLEIPCTHGVVLRDWLVTEQLLCKGKYHCTTDLLFDWFGFNETIKSVDIILK